MTSDRRKQERVAVLDQGPIGPTEGNSADGADAMRQRARELYELGRWRACIDTVLELAEHGDIDPTDTRLLAGAYKQLGNNEAAKLFFDMGEDMLSTLGMILDTLNGAPSE